MLIVANKLHFMVLFGSRISVLIKQIHEKLLVLSHKLLFFASFSGLLFVLSFFLLFSHHGSISKQNTFKMDTKNNNYYVLILNVIVQSLIWLSRWERPVLVRTFIILDNQCRSHLLQSQMTVSFLPADCQSLLTTILLRTPQDLENKIPLRYGMSLMGSNLLQWLLYGKQLPRPSGALWLAIAWSGF